jgi:hypothetical protein
MFSMSSPIGIYGTGNDNGNSNWVRLVIQQQNPDQTFTGFVDHSSGSKDHKICVFDDCRKVEDEYRFTTKNLLIPMLNEKWTIKFNRDFSGVSGSRELLYGGQSLYKVAYGKLTSSIDSNGFPANSMAGTYTGQLNGKDFVLTFGSRSSPTATPATQSASVIPDGSGQVVVGPVQGPSAGFGTATIQVGGLTYPGELQYSGGVHDGVWDTYGGFIVVAADLLGPGTMWRVNAFCDDYDYKKFSGIVESLGAPNEPRLPIDLVRS